MKALLSVTAVFILTSVSVYTQTQSAAASPCSLKVAQSPAVRGVKLGMKTQDLLALFPGSADRDDIRNVLAKVEGYPNFGVISIYIRPDEYSTKDRFEGVVNYSLLFVDGRLGEYQVQYRPPPFGPKWRQPDDFIAKLAEAYELPRPASWTTDQNVNAWKTLKCDGFQVRASTMNFQGALTVAAGEAPWTTKQQRQAAFEENIRREFKP
jgi:hypothetical protein